MRGVPAYEKMGPEHVANCAVEKQVESMLRAFPQKAAKHPDKDPMAKSMRELLTCVAGAGDDFLASDHKEPAGIISDLMRSKSLTVERLLVCIQAFCPGFDTSNLDAPFNVDVGRGALQAFQRLNRKGVCAECDRGLQDQGR